MSSKETPREFNMTYAELEEVTRNLVLALNRDISDLSIFGISSINVNNLASLCESLENTRTDIEYEGDLMVKTEEKNTAAENVREQIRFMAARADAVFGIGSAKYETFKFEDMNRLSDTELLKCGRRVVRVATQYKIDLAGVGVTDAMLLEFTDLCDVFEAASETQETFADARRVAAEERIRKANEIYDYDTEYSNFGKKFYAKRNAAKYEDYLLYPGGPTGKPGKIQNLVFTAPTSTISWDVSSPASLTYQCEISPDGETWTLAYEDSGNSFGYGHAPGTYFARCRGINENGSGAWSDTLQFEILLGVPNIWEATYNPGLHEISIQWYAVQYADYFDLYRSVVPIGDPAGAYTLIQSPVNHLYQNEETTFGKTHYYYIVSRMGAISSLPSVTVSMNIPMDQ